MNDAWDVVRGDVWVRSGRIAAVAATALAIIALSVGGPIQAREPGPRDVPRSTTPVPPPFKARSLPFVSITRQDGEVKYYETNAVPLLWERACFGWRTFIGGPNRQVEMVEVLTLSAMSPPPPAFAAA